MSEAEKLREHAARLFALALKTLEAGRQASADALTNLAHEALTKAEKIEAKRLPPPPDNSQPVVQQQQQPQPDTDKDA